MPKRHLPFDPVEAAELAEEQARYHYHLFHPIYESTHQFEPQWLIHNWLALGSLNILAAPPKSGKTSFATQLALSVATGTPFAGMPTRSAAVLWLSLEESPDERRFLLKQNPLAEPSTPLYTCYEPLQIDRPATIEALEYWINQTSAELIIIDPLQAAATGHALETGANARRALTLLKSLCVRRSVTALVLHHIKAPARNQFVPRVADHEQLSATVSTLMIMSTRQAAADHAHGGSADRLISLHCQGRGSHANRVLSFLSSDPADYRLLDSEDLTKNSLPERPHFAAELVEQFLQNRPADGATLCESLGMNPFTLRSALTRLRAQGLVRVNKVRGRRNVYLHHTWSPDDAATVDLDFAAAKAASEERAGDHPRPPRPQH